MDITVINPATGETIDKHPFHTSNELNEIIENMATASKIWSGRDIHDRASLLNNLANLLRDSKDSLAKKITVEMGKPISESQAEIEKCAWVCDYYSENGIEFLENETIPSGASKSYVSFRPLGIVLAIMPWNFPFWQVFRFAIPALLAGNSGLLKHAPNVTGCALLIEELFIKAGFRENIFKTIKATNHQVSEVIQNPSIKAVTLTGSTRAGREVAAEAGRNLKKLVLELGGSDPYIILSDANLGTAVEACISGRFLNNGQSCIAAKRIIAVKEI